MEDLKQGLPQYTALGVGRDDGKEAGEYCPIFFNLALSEGASRRTLKVITSSGCSFCADWFLQLPRSIRPHTQVSKAMCFMFPLFLF